MSLNLCCLPNIASLLGSALRPFLVSGVSLSEGRDRCVLQRKSLRFIDFIMATGIKKLVNMGQWKAHFLILLCSVMIHLKYFLAQCTGNHLPSQILIINVKVFKKRPLRVIKLCLINGLFINALTQTFLKKLIQPANEHHPFCYHILSVCKVHSHFSF